MNNMDNVNVKASRLFYVPSQDKKHRIKACVSYIDFNENGTERRAIQLDQQCPALVFTLQIYAGCITN